MKYKHKTPFGEQLAYIVIPVLIAIVGFSGVRVAHDIFDDQSSRVSVQSPQVQQKHIRYRFRRIYNGGDVMTAPHAGATFSSPNMSSASSYRSPISQVGASAPVAYSYRGSFGGGNAGGVGSGLTALQSRQTLNSYSSGGGMAYGGQSAGGYSSSSASSVSYGGYSTSIPSLASISNSRSLSVTLQDETADRSRRGAKQFLDSGLWGDSETGETGTWNTTTGAVYNSEGEQIGTYSAGVFTTQGDADEENRAPIGPATLTLVLFAVLYMLKKRKDLIPT